MSIKFEEFFILPWGENAWTIDFVMGTHDIRVYIAKNPQNEWAICNFSGLLEHDVCPICKKVSKIPPFCDCSEQAPIREKIIQLIRLRLLSKGYCFPKKFTHIDNDWKKPIVDWRDGRYEQKNNRFPNRKLERNEDK